MLGYKVSLYLFFQLAPIGMPLTIISLLQSCVRGTIPDPGQNHTSIRNGFIRDNGRGCGA